jgi:SOS-response transcriptional repressor LexA
LVMDFQTTGPMADSEREEKNQLRFLGTIQAGINHEHGPNGKNELIDCSTSIIKRYRRDQLFVLKIVGDSMTSATVRNSVPEGSYVVFHSALEPRHGDLVAAWVCSKNSPRKTRRWSSNRTTRKDHDSQRGRTLA